MEQVAQEEQVQPGELEGQRGGDSGGQIWVGSSGRARLRNGPASMAAISALPPDVGVDPPAFLGRGHHPAQLVIGQDQAAPRAG
jgi:hypothetical protein